MYFFPIRQFQLCIISTRGFITILRCRVVILMEIKEKSEKKMFDEKVKEKSVNFTSKGRNQRKVIENKNVRKFFQTETKYQDFV